MAQNPDYEEELIVPDFNKRDIEKIALKLRNTYDLRHYGVIESDEGLNITSGQLYEIINDSYKPENPTIVICKSGDYTLTLICSVLQDIAAKTPSYTFTANCKSIGLISFEVEKGSLSNVQFVIE